MTGKKPITSVPTDGQLKQVNRLAEDAIRDAIKKGSINKDRIQKLIENGDEFQKRIITAAYDLSVLSQHTDEEVKTSLGYSRKYRILGLDEQIERLQEFFPRLKCADEQLFNQGLPANAEGLFAIPRWQTISSTYGGAVQAVINLIKRTRHDMFESPWDGHLDPRHLRQSLNSAKAWKKIGDEQKNYDILVVPAQFGLRHRGRSVRLAREVMSANEFGLGAYEVGIMILTHPWRLNTYRGTSVSDNEDELFVLSVDCAGDEISPKANKKFPCSLNFEFNCGVVWLNARRINGACEDSGSASGFLI